ncbi:MAG TPA: DNA-3-methyladenine glycosylase I [Ignavibacteria bacterium]
MKKNFKRCSWCLDDPILIDYHDNEWGKKIIDDNKLFERMTLEVFQAGLSWKIILLKREALRRAFSQFDIDKVSKYNEKKIEKLLQDKNIIRNKRKIMATVYNAKSIKQIQKEFGSFYNFIQNLDISNNTVKELKKYFKFMGNETVKCFLIGCGRVEPEHDKHCFLYNKR